MNCVSASHDLRLALNEALTNKYILWLVNSEENIMFFVLFTNSDIFFFLAFHLKPTTFDYRKNREILSQGKSIIVDSISGLNNHQKLK